MGKFCCVVGCGKRSERDKDVSFFKVPSIISHQGKQTLEISKKRREKWLANIRRDAIETGEVKMAFVCSFHFHQGNYKKVNPCFIHLYLKDLLVTNWTVVVVVF